MATHLCRDLLGTNTSWRAHLYLLSLFLRRVLKYTHVGSTNFGVNAVGTLLIATGDSTPTAAPTFAAGHKAGINYGGGLEYYVGIPIADHTVVAGDVGRLLVLKSTANPKHNSGIFRVTGIDTPNNRLLIDYRSTEFPPAEADDSIEWYLYESDSFASIPNSGTTNGGTGYRGNGTSTNGRIILQSPHATGWQVRLCLENSTDYFTNAITSPSSVAPGFGGNSAGDFPVGGRHLHPPMFADSAASAYQFSAVGPGAASSTIYRYTMIGDDIGQAFAVMLRYSSGQGLSSMLVAGICDNEPSPLPADDVGRLFVIGDGYGANIGNYLNDISWFCGRGDVGPRAQGVAFGTGFVRPVAATWGAWNYLYGATNAANVLLEATAGDSPYTSSTELLRVTVLAGMAGSNTSTNTGAFPYEPRPLGEVPFLRMGRANFGNYTLTTDAGKAWKHFRNGVFMEWSGPSLVP